MKKNNKKAFTLAELLVVVAIIAVLAAISIPVFTGALNKAKLAADKAEIRAVYAEKLIEEMSDDPTAGEYDVELPATATNGSAVTVSGQDVSVGGEKVFSADSDVTVTVK